MVHLHMLQVLAQGKRYVRERLNGRGPLKNNGATGWCQQLQNLSPLTNTSPENRKK